MSSSQHGPEQSAPQFEPYKKHRRGRKTFLYLYITHTWILNLVGIACIWLAYLMYYGALNQKATAFFAVHSSWYIDVPMVSSWFLLLGIMILILAYMIGYRYYVHYKFIFDDHAFHLHKGFFFIRETTIPYQQVSNVHIARPYTYRMFGLAKLDIVTAADKSLSHGEAKDKEFLIPIIDTKKARALSKQLISFAAKIRKGQDPFAGYRDPEEDEIDEVDEVDDGDGEGEDDNAENNDQTDMTEILSVDDVDDENNLEIDSDDMDSDVADNMDGDAFFIEKNPAVMPRVPNTDKNPNDPTDQNEPDEIGDIDDIRQLELIEDEDLSTRPIKHKVY
jgi:membrane protein YdbS with pleckstrin-like domain